jgi:hypothetical protein
VVAQIGVAYDAHAAAEGIVLAQPEPAVEYVAFACQLERTSMNPVTFATISRAHSCEM